MGLISFKPKRKGTISKSGTHTDFSFVVIDVVSGDFMEVSEASVVKRINY